MREDQVETILRKAVLECLVALRDHSHDDDDPASIFESPRSQTIKQEMIDAGRKLWQRQYVDGNGGNLSYRISDRYVLCTPTLCSKADLTLDDFSLVDLENVQLCGTRPQTSEIRLHLEIYKAVPEARAVIHCHPPYATAHAIAGILPPANLIPEQEVFVGPMALAPYDTPGTWEFARTVLPYVKKHNTVLLTNHGIVCWADTVTHAEWYVEVADTYCKTALIARQLSPKLPEIPADKVLDLLAMKKRLGLPDARFEDTPTQPGTRREFNASIPLDEDLSFSSRRDAIPSALESLIAKFTSEVCQTIGKEQ